MTKFVKFETQTKNRTIINCMRSITNISGLPFKALFFFIYGILTLDHIGTLLYRGAVNSLNSGLGDLCSGPVRALGFVLG